MKVQPLLSPIKMGDLVLKNRVVVAALTRMRASNETHAPNDMHVDYYSSRADAGFILSECSAINLEGDAFPGSASIETEEQVNNWKRVVDAVHAKGGRIFLQIWHGGRACHPEQIRGILPLAPSPIAINGLARTPSGVMKKCAVPREATKEDIRRIIHDFRRGAENAKKAGFDGLQLHGAHGYLIDSFLRDGANKRTDDYGGNLENRSRLCFEVLDQLIDVYGSERVGIKLSPVFEMQDMTDSDPFALMEFMIEKLNQKRIAFVEVNEGVNFSSHIENDKRAAQIYAGRRE